ncbi:MAG: HD-GYP domain-containing protein [Lachnospiraceae bacterium]
MGENVKEKNTLLIVDDVEINRYLLKVIFEEQYEIMEAENGEEAIEKLKDYPDIIALIFLDLQMPKKNGLDVLTFMNENGLIDLIPVIMITGDTTVENDVKAYELGASDIIYKPFEPAIVIRRALNIIELFEHRINLEKKLEKRTAQLRESQQKLEKNNEFLINALSSVVEFRSLESGEHIKRVKTFTGIILYHLQKMYPEYGLTNDQVKLIVNAAALHDIGKIAISDEILLKPGKLTKEEFEIMKTHTTKGCEILEMFKQEENEFYQYCYDICRYHHERYDGNGYPDKMSGEDIPIWAQVVSIVDVFDALVSKRVYKMPYAVEEAERMILSGECGVFSPKIIDCFEMAKYELFELTEGKFSFVDSE